MLPKWHIFYGAVFALFLWFVWPGLGWVNALIIFLASFLIDADHYLHYVFRKRDLNLRKSFKWFIDFGPIYEKLSNKERKEIYLPVCIFHSIEVFLILGILSFFYTWALMVLIGFAFHRFLDEVWKFTNEGERHTISFIYSFYKIRKKGLKHLEEMKN